MNVIPYGSTDLGFAEALQSTRGYEAEVKMSKFIGKKFSGKTLSNFTYDANTCILTLWLVTDNNTIETKRMRMMPQNFTLSDYVFYNQLNWVLTYNVTATVKR